MAAGMSRGKVERVGFYFKQRLGEGWRIEEDKHRLYCPGAVIAVKGDVTAVLDINYAPFLRLRAADGEEAVLPLPFLEAEKLGALAAGIACAAARMRQQPMPRAAAEAAPADCVGEAPPSHAHRWAGAGGDESLEEWWERYKREHPDIG